MLIQQQLKRLQKYLPESILCAIAIFLYTYQLGYESFWIDEILSVESAQGPLNLNRPLYFILLRYWMLLGQSDVWLRSLSVLFGLGCILLTYNLANRLVNRKVALLSALLLTLSPLALNHAQEVRFYAMSTFFGIAGSLCLSQGLAQASNRTNKTTNSLFPLAGWIIFRCIGFLTAQPNILLLLPDSLLILWQLSNLFPKRLSLKNSPLKKSPKKHQKRRLYYGLLSLLCLAIPTSIILKDVVPELIEFLSYTTYVDQTKPDLLSFVGKLSALTVWPLRGPEYEWADDTFYQLVFQIYSLITIGLIAFALLNNPLENARKQLSCQKTSELIQLALWGLLPILSMFAFSQVFPILWEDRYALISAPYVLILLAVSWIQLYQNKKRLAILLAAIYLLSMSGSLLRYYTSNYRADWRELSQLLLVNVEPDESIIVYPGSLVEIINYYYDGSANFVPVDDIIQAEDVSATDIVEIAEQISSAQDNIWIVCPVVEHWAEAQAEVVDLLEESGFQIQRTAFLTDQWAWGPALYAFSNP